jgi:hypothetical protein
VCRKEECKLVIGVLNDTQCDDMEDYFPGITLADARGWANRSRVFHQAGALSLSAKPRTST